MYELVITVLFINHLYHCMYTDSYVRDMINSSFGPGFNSDLVYQKTF